jgi:hypothetical protein
MTSLEFVIGSVPEEVLSRRKTFSPMLPAIDIIGQRHGIETPGAEAEGINQGADAGGCVLG